MKYLVLAILLLSSLANAGITLDEKYLLPNVLYVNAGGTLGTSLTTATNIVSRTENGVSNFYINNFSIEGFYNQTNAVATKLGSCSLQVPVGTTVASFNLVNPTASGIDRIIVNPSTPIVVSKSFAISCQALTTTGTSWYVNYSGWEY